MRADIGRLPEEGAVLKSDARTRVWCTTDSGQPAQADTTVYVVKEYKISPVRQRLAWLFGCHPAQRETRWSKKLAMCGLAVAEPVGHRWEQGRLRLVYPWRGHSLMNVLVQRGLPIAVKQHFAQQIAGALATFIRHHLFNRDHKLSNIVVDSDHRLWQVDVGGVRRAATRSHLVRMLGTLHESARRGGASRGDCWRVLRQLIEHAPVVGDSRTLAREVLRFHHH